MRGRTDGYVDAIAAHETAILQYMTDYGADFRILDEPLLITGIGAAFSADDDRGLAQELMDTFRQSASGRDHAGDRRQVYRASRNLFGGGMP